MPEEFPCCRNGLSSIGRNTSSAEHLVARIPRRQDKYLIDHLSLAHARKGRVQVDSSRKVNASGDMVWPLSIYRRLCTMHLPILHLCMLAPCWRLSMANQPPACYFETASEPLHLPCMVSPMRRVSSHCCRAMPMTRRCGDHIPPREAACCISTPPRRRGRDAFVVLLTQARGTFPSSLRGTVVAAPEHVRPGRGDDITPIRNKDPFCINCRVGYPPIRSPAVRCVYPA